MALQGTYLTARELLRAISNRVRQVPSLRLGFRFRSGVAFHQRLQLGNNYFEIPFVCKQRSAAQPEDEPARINSFGSEIFPLEEAQTAYDRMMSGNARFRVVLKIAS
jgi:hypothetical protein